VEPTTRWTLPASAIYVAPAEARPLEAVNLFDLERQAAEVLPPTTWDYYAGGAEDELTVAENVAAFRRIKLRPRMLAPVQQRNLATTLFSDSVALPVLTAPTAFARLAHPDAELAVARATAALGTIGVYSTLSHYPISEIELLWAQCRISIPSSSMIRGKVPKPNADRRL
jgi:4-hydroxymandelate oxidase